MKVTVVCCGRFVADIFQSFVSVSALNTWLLVILLCQYSYYLLNTHITWSFLILPAQYSYYLVNAPELLVTLSMSLMTGCIVHMHVLVPLFCMVWLKDTCKHCSSNLDHYNKRYVARRSWSLSASQPVNTVFPASCMNHSQGSNCGVQWDE